MGSRDKATRQGAAWVIPALATLRGVLAAVCVIASLHGLGSTAMAAALWYAIPAALVLSGARWVLWLLILMNGLVAGLGLLVLPGFGRLHGGEVFAFAAAPAVIEIALAVHALRNRARCAERTPGMD